MLEVRGSLRLHGRRCLQACLLAACLLLPGGSAFAVGFTLDVEFDVGVTGTFANVEVSEEATGLLFEVSLTEALGPDADLHYFYFNLDDDADLRLESDDDVTTAYVLSQAPSVVGGAGSDFDYGVSFGNGAGPPGNGVLQRASFLVLPVDPDQSLSLDDFLNAEWSSAAGGKVFANAAAHVQGTSLMDGSSSETIGGVVPEPATGLMMACGLLLAARWTTSRADPRVAA